jgi:hypothetical protein
MCITTRRGRPLSYLAALTLLPAGCGDHTPPLEPGAPHLFAEADGGNVVQVAPPTGDVATDRGSILAALEEVRPGGTVRFAPGTYLIGIDIPLSREPIRVTVPHITLLGHPEGTTLRGCDWSVITGNNCFGLELSGGHQTVRSLTFEDLTAGVVIGRWPVPVPIESRVGGYRIEANTFRNSIFGVRMFGQWQEPAVIRSNTFINTVWSVEVFGRLVYVLDNIFGPDQGQVTDFEPFQAISFVSWGGIQSGPCDHNVAAGNRIEGYWTGVSTSVTFDGEGCRHIMIRHNAILDTRSVEFEPVGLVPGRGVAVSAGPDPYTIAHTLIQGNHIHRTEGLGIVVLGGAHVRVTNNDISDVTTSPSAPIEFFAEADGAGVWLWLGSQNQVLNNRFANVASDEVFLDGSDYNHVVIQSAIDVVRDLGIGNRITGPGSVVSTAAPAVARLGAVPSAAERNAVDGGLDPRNRLRDPIGLHHPIPAPRVAGGMRRRRRRRTS